MFLSPSTSISKRRSLANISPSMKHFPSALRRVLRRPVEFFQSKTTLARRAPLATEARKCAASEAERLDRLRRPENYRSR